MFALLALLACHSVEGRQTIDLNAGWSYARIPRPPSIWSGPDAVPTSTWRVVDASSEETAQESAQAAKAFDGDPATFWHTEWSKRVAAYPHQLTIDLGSPTEAVGIRLLPRQTGPQNGRPNRFQAYLYNEGDKLTRPLFEGSAPDPASLFEAKFPAAKGRFLRLVFFDGHRPAEPFLALSEIGLIRNLDKSKQKDWKSQYDIASVESGDHRFDLSGSDLERLRPVELAKIVKWSSATLPHAAWVRPLNKPEIWQGVAYYRRALDLTTAQLGRHLEFTLDGAMQSSDLWLNGKLLASRRGGYLPMIVDMTGKLKLRNELLVRVDNSDNPLIPPGKPQSQLDFMYGSGLTRNAALTISNKVFVTNPLEEGIPNGGGVSVWFPLVDAQLARVSVRTHVRNLNNYAHRITIRHRLLDGFKVVSSTEISTGLQANFAKPWILELDVSQPRLWSPDHPNLYRLKTEILEGDVLLDSVTTQVGIRKIEVSRAKGFVINGQPLRLVGTNRHQDYPWVGPALSDAANRRDAFLIKQSGHNIVRLSHYPQSPAFLDACDELGILTIPCIPGWQFVNRDYRFAKRVRRDIKDLIHRDRNHPSVAFWEASLNETYPGAEVAKDWNDTAKSEGFDILTAGDGTAGAPWDVVYNGWKEDLSRPQDAAPDRPGYIREYGDYEFGGAYSTSRVKMGQGLDKLLQETWNHVWSYNKFRTQYPWTMGAGTWEMFDHNVPWEFSVSASGLADIMRREKPSFWFYRSQVETKPYLRIAATWQPGAAKRDVVVFTNAPEASLYVNGKWVGTARAERGPETDYAKAKPFSGTDTANLPHPPIVFHDIPFAVGQLRVVGSNKASDIVRTAGKPVSLMVWIDDLGVSVTSNDLVFVRAAIVDAEGIICPADARRVTFTVTGLTIAGESSAPAEMGVASILVRTPKSLKGMRIVASAAGLLNGRRDLPSSFGSPILQVRNSHP